MTPEQELAEVKQQFLIVDELYRRECHRSEELRGDLKQMAAKLSLLSET